MVALLLGVAIGSVLILGLLAWIVQVQRRQQAHIKTLNRRVVEITTAYQRLVKAQRKVPGVVAGEKDWHVLVNGERVEVRPLSGAEWLAALEELPGFIFALAQDAEKGKALEGKELDKIMELAKAWIKASAVREEGVILDLLTLPEAEHALTHIAILNGITPRLREFFRQQLTSMARAAQSGSSLRDPSEQPVDGAN